jgi:hypothetical protein
MKQLAFTLGLRTVCSQLPYGKTPKDDEIKFLWILLPQSVAAEVTDEMWAYACQQRLMDPAPDDRLPIFQQILRHLYRLRDGQPEFAWGLRPDLPQRMAQANRFQPLFAATPPPPAPALAPPEPQVPESPQARRARLLALAESAGIDLSQPPAPRTSEVTHG